MNDRGPRLEELAKDPAHDGKVSEKSLHEASVALALEESGRLKGPIRRDPRPSGGDFIDQDGNVWDIKSFDSRWPPRKGGFVLERDILKISEELKKGEHIILDTTNLTASHAKDLREAVASRGWVGRILWYPD